MRLNKIIPLVLSLLMVASLLFAPKAMAGDIYVGAALTQSYVDEQVDADGVDILLDGDTTGMRLALGYLINDYFAVELAHTDFGDLNESVLGLDVSAAADAQEFALLGRLPLSERFGLFGRLGYAWWDGETVVETVVNSTSGKDVFVGAGLEFAVGESVSFALSGTKYRLDELDIAVLGFGIRYRF